PPKPQLAKFQIAGRGTDRLICLVHVQLGVLRTIVHDQVDNHATSAAGAVAGAVNLVALDDAPLAAWSPVLLELIQRILRVLLRMLLPARIGVVNAICCFKVLLLQRRKEFIGHMLLWPEAVPPANEGQE